MIFFEISILMNNIIKILYLTATIFILLQLIMVRNQFFFLIYPLWSSFLQRFPLSEVQVLID